MYTYMRRCVIWLQFRLFTQSEEYLNRSIYTGKIVDSLWVIGDILKKGKYTCSISVQWAKSNVNNL